MSENPQETERVNPTEQSDSDLATDNPSTTNPTNVKGLGQDGARERPHEEEAKQSAPKRRGRKPKGTMNDVTDTKQTKKDKVTNCTTEKSKSNETTLDAADLVGVRKIRTYFTPIPKGQDPLSMPKHCFEDCLHNRAGEAVGIMTACDACETLYHHDCVANKSMARPCKKKVWFCNDCKLIFRNMKNISKEKSLTYEAN